MTKQQLIETIRRVIKEALEENAPAPSKPQKKPGVKKPPVKSPSKPTPRRRVGNPDIAKDPDQKPGPKAEAKKATMTEADILAKIVKRFRSAKQMNENTEQKYAYVKIHKYVDGKVVNVVGFYPDPKGTFTKERANNLPNVSKYDKWEISFHKNKKEAELAIKAKQMNESPKKTWAEGYEEGYKIGFKDAKDDKPNKFTQPTKEAQIKNKKPEFKGFEKKFVPKGMQRASLPKTNPYNLGGSRGEYDDSNVNYITDPYEKVLKTPIKKDNDD